MAFYTLAQHLYLYTKHTNMDSKELQEKWPEIKKRIKEEHPHITDSDLLCELGKEADLILSLQEKLGKTDKEIKNWLSLMG